MVRDHGSVLKPNQESLAFLDSLYEEFLPHFSSSKFNVGLDEPWELGQGWSKSKVQEIGKHKVYLEHLNGILSLVEKRGKSMEFGQMSCWKIQATQSSYQHLLAYHLGL